MLIYANLWHGLQMFSQISRIPDLIRKFWAKRRGLYTGVYGNCTCNNLLNLSPLTLWQALPFFHFWHHHLRPKLRLCSKKFLGSSLGTQPCRLGCPEVKLSNFNNINKCMITDWTSNKNVLPSILGIIILFTDAKYKKLTCNFL